MVSTVIVSTLALRSWICATFLKTANFFTFQFLGGEFSHWCPGAGQEVEDFNRDGDQGKVDEGLRHLHQVSHLPILLELLCLIIQHENIQTQRLKCYKCTNTGSSNIRNKTNTRTFQAQEVDREQVQTWSCSTGTCRRLGSGWFWDLVTISTRVGSLSQSWILLAESNTMLASHWSIFSSLFWLY